MRAVIADPGRTRRVISTLHGLGVPQGVRPMHMGFEVVAQCAPRSGGTAFWFILNPARSQGRPHFIRPTLGWRAESLWDRTPGTFDALWMDAPRSGGVRCGCRVFPCRGGVYRKRQRRSSLQPRVARPALPWEPVPRIYQPHRGCGPDRLHHPAVRSAGEDAVAVNGAPFMAVKTSASVIRFPKPLKVA